MADRGVVPVLEHCERCEVSWDSRRERVCWVCGQEGLPGGLRLVTRLPESFWIRGVVW